MLHAGEEGLSEVSSCAVEEAWILGSLGFAEETRASLWGALSLFHRHRCLRLMALTMALNDMSSAV